MQKNRFFLSFICTYKKIYVILQSKIYAGGLCLFNKGGFSDILNSVYWRFVFDTRNFATFEKTVKIKVNSRCLWV